MHMSIDRHWFGQGVIQNLQSLPGGSATRRTLEHILRKHGPEAAEAFILANCPPPEKKPVVAVPPEMATSDPTVSRRDLGGYSVAAVLGGFVIGLGGVASRACRQGENHSEPRKGDEWADVHPVDQLIMMGGFGGAVASLLLPSVGGVIIENAIHKVIVKPDEDCNEAELFMKQVESRIETQADERRNGRGTTR